ncbi:uncharacterized protein Eint_041445 [Encephalitozoon intestinalis ATCC 50506]|uniref:Uncharacterized protein n=1 Tax=Encephalitozoon intestinalis (strain ATCC 50506) TaxID=876142 RepID=W8PKF5_ENCIT|nr:uncharacterized protein Eint_041445 [Encephalitozoon intestinalis ATCC 50506]AHL30095.1 hypothetical protein Eint_041445 [Encephalitozoon intestinalis ATCC 50506]UTX45127.1 hypothetical protein GPK93_04g06670 [Encephalitozoon intestinalis]
MSRTHTLEIPKNNRKRLINRLIEAIESLSCNEMEEHGDVIHISGFKQDEWSETKMKFMRKYGHMK